MFGAPYLPGFVVEGPLGRGGEASVWAAVEESTGRPVALKQLHTPSAADRLRLHREAALLSGIEHPHVLKLLGVHDGPDGVLLVLERAEGGSLLDSVTTRGALPPGEVVTATGPIAQALAMAHATGLLHGDVTPGNVLFSADGRPMLADLGLARLAGERPDHIGGTHGFTAPEVLGGEAPTPASDVYSLAVTVRTALVGVLPDDPRAALVKSPPLPATPVSVVERALGVEPRNRPSAAELADALFRLAAPRPLRLTPTLPTAAPVRPRVEAPAPPVTHRTAPAPEPPPTQRGNGSAQPYSGRRVRRAPARNQTPPMPPATLPPSLPMPPPSPPMAAPKPAASPPMPAPGAPLPGAAPGSSLPPSGATPESVSARTPAPMPPARRSTAPPGTDVAARSQTGLPQRQPRVAPSELARRGKPSLAPDDVRKVPAAPQTHRVPREQPVEPPPRDADRVDSSEHHDMGRFAVLLIVPALIIGAAFLGWQWWESRQSTEAAPRLDISRPLGEGEGASAALCGGAPTAVPAAVPPIADDWTVVIDDLYAQIAAAYTDADPSELCLAYVPTSKGLEVDQAKINEYLRVGAHAQGMDFTVYSADVITVEPTRVVLEITDELPAYSIVDQAGVVRGEGMALPRQTWKAELLPSTDGTSWRFG